MHFLSLGLSLLISRAFEPWEIGGVLVTTRSKGIVYLLQTKCANYCLSWDSAGRIFLKRGSTCLSEFQLKAKAFWMRSIMTPKVRESLF